LSFEHALSGSGAPQKFTEFKRAECGEESMSKGSCKQDNHWLWPFLKLIQHVIMAQNENYAQAVFFNLPVTC
jgi:hypothetical protein